MPAIRKWAKTSTDLLAAKPTAMRETRALQLEGETRGVRIAGSRVLVMQGHALNVIEGNRVREIELDRAMPFGVVGDLAFLRHRTGEVSCVDLASSTMVLQPTQVGHSPIVTRDGLIVTVPLKEHVWQSGSLTLRETDPRTGATRDLEVGASAAINAIACHDDSIFVSHGWEQGSRIAYAITRVRGGEVSTIVENVKKRIVALLPMGNGLVTSYGKEVIHFDDNLRIVGRGPLTTMWWIHHVSLFAGTRIVVHGSDAKSYPVAPRVLDLATGKYTTSKHVLLASFEHAERTPTHGGVARDENHFWFYAADGSVGRAEAVDEALTCFGDYRDGLGAIATLDGMVRCFA